MKASGTGLEHLIRVFVRGEDIKEFCRINAELTKPEPGISDVGSRNIKKDNIIMITYSPLCVMSAGGRAIIGEARKLLIAKGLAEREGNFYFKGCFFEYS